MLAYIDGKFLEDKDARISVLDLGLLRGCAVFDYLRTYDRQPFHLWDHLLRLRYSAGLIGLAMPPLPQVQGIVEQLLDATKGESGLRILLTGGTSPDPLLPRSDPSLICIASPLQPYPSSYYQQGLCAITTTLQRSFPTCKTTHYLPAIVALSKQSGGAQEVLFLSAKGELLEGSTSNLFFFMGDALYTCHSEEVLFGITRELVLRLCKPLFPILERGIHLQEIPEVQEAFLTASNKEIMPLVQIDGMRIGSGQVGPRTQLVMQRFGDYVRKRHWPPLHTLRYADT